MSKAVLFFLIAGSLIACGQTAEPAAPQPDYSLKRDTTKADPHIYPALRNMALNMTPAQLNLELPSTGTQVFGLVMDWNIGNIMVTLTAFATGDASLYINNGSGIRGGIQDPVIAEKAKIFVTHAQQYLDKATAADTSAPLPAASDIRLYLLTNKGRFLLKEQIGDFENESSPWLNLFLDGNTLITALRESAVPKQ